MKQKTLKVKGMKVPRFFIWILGFIHSRILKTAVINPETGYICSSYVTDKCKLFNELSSRRVKQLENELKAVRTEAFVIIAEEAKIRKLLKEDVIGKFPSSINEKKKGSSLRISS